MIRAATPDEKFRAATYIANKIGVSFNDLIGDMPFEVILTGKGALLYTNWRGDSIEVAAAGESGWFTRPVARAMFAYPFNQLKCHSLVAFTERQNKLTRDLLKRLGFQELAVIESGRGRRSDKMLYVITRRKCVWLDHKRRVTDGKARAKSP